MTERQQQQEEQLGKGGIIGFMAVSVLIFFILAWMLCPVTIVDGGYRGVMTEFGAVSTTVYEPGPHFRWPIRDTMHQVYVGTNKVDLKVGGASNDLQTVNMDLALNYHIDPSRVITIYRDLGNDEVDRVIYPAIQEISKQVLAQYTAEQLITKREEVNDKISMGLRARLAQYGIIAEGTSVLNFSFSHSFDESIEAKITAQQNALRVENEVKQTEYEAKKRVVQSEADLAIAKNTAEANDMIGKSLQNNPGIVELKRIEKWDGHYPQYMMGGSQPMLQIK